MFDAYLIIHGTVRIPTFIIEPRHIAHHVLTLWKIGKMVLAGLDDYLLHLRVAEHARLHGGGNSAPAFEEEARPSEANVHHVQPARVKEIHDNVLQSLEADPALAHLFLHLLSAADSTLVFKKWSQCSVEEKAAAWPFLVFSPAPVKGSPSRQELKKAGLLPTSYHPAKTKPDDLIFATTKADLESYFRAYDEAYTF
jgi:hypothetical protein